MDLKEAIPYLIIIVAIFSLTTLAIAYWIILRQDSTVLTTVSSIIGGVIGYMVRKLWK